MTPITIFNGQRIALFGLGGSGKATARALMAGGAMVDVWDDNTDACITAQGEGFTAVDLRTADWRAYAAFVLTPGVPLTHPEPHWTVAKAKAEAVEIIGDVELFFRQRRAAAPGSPVVAITGTNGKSTTTALIAHVFRQAGYDVQMGGNIGTAVLMLDPPAPNRIHVLEISSFQIDLAPSADPTVAVMLNLTPDHIDRHGTLEAYAAVKERLVQGAANAVVSIDDAWSLAMANRNEEVGRATIRFSVEGPVARGLYAERTDLHFARGGSDRVIASIANIGSLRGSHNAQNALAATASALLLGVDPARIQQGLSTYPGLPHRMEQVGFQGRVLFINDSKATNADSAEKALAAFERGIYWIVGGKAKDGGIKALEPYFERVARAYLIGAASDEFAETLSGKVAFERCDTIAKALEAAAIDAAIDTGDQPVVLLSPACASYDQFKNFEMRGNHFRDLALALPGFVPIGAPALEG
jgi:UDP-N-acetylmuramoylalanine--D-glutamate ligase